MVNMTEHLRQEVRVAMIRQRINQTELAEKAGLSRQHVSNLLTGHRGKLPEAWEKVLDSLNLQLTVEPKRTAEES